MKKLFVMISGGQIKEADGISHRFGKLQQSCCAELTAASTNFESGE